MKIMDKLMMGSLLACATTALAGPLQRADVPANPSWVLHIDCDVMRPTTIGQYLMGELAKPEADAKFAAFQTIFNFDPRSALHGMTLYSTGPSPQDGILLVYADFDTARLEVLAKAAKDYKSTPYKNHTVHNWIDEKRPVEDGVQPRTFAAIHGGKVVVFGQLEARVTLALDVLDRNVANLAAGSSFPLMGAVSGAFIQAAGRKLDIPSTDPGAAVFRMAKEGYFQFGEAQSTMNAKLKLTAADSETAGHLSSIAQGMISLMKLQTEKPDNVKLAQAMSISTTGTDVTGTIELPAADVVEMLKAAAARKSGTTTATQ